MDETRQDIHPENLWLFKIAHFCDYYVQ